MVMTAVRHERRPTSGNPRGDGRLLVVVGGLPGSGKTTLLRRWLARPVPGIEGLDSELVAARLRAAGVRPPYRLLRPMVHGVHRWRVLRAMRGTTPVVVLTDPWTSPAWRAAVLRAAVRAGRPVRLVLIDASREAAEGGQTARGRAVSARAMRRHSLRWARVLTAARNGGTTVVVAREEAGRLTLDQVLGEPTA